MELSDIEPAFWVAKEDMEILTMRIDKLEEQTLEFEWAMKKLQKQLQAIDEILERAVSK